MKIYKGKVYTREFDSGNGYYSAETTDVTNGKENFSESLEEFVGKDVTIMIFEDKPVDEERPLNDADKIRLNEEYHRQIKWR